MRHFLFFDRFLFPGIATFIYWLGLIVIIATALYSVVSVLSVGGASLAGSLLGLRGFVPGPVAALIVVVTAAITAVLWRLLSEFWLVIFSIRELLRDIREQGRMR